MVEKGKGKATAGEQVGGEGLEGRGSGEDYGKVPDKEKGAGIEGMNASGGGGNVKQGDNVGQGGRSSAN